MELNNFDTVAKSHKLRIEYSPASRISRNDAFYIVRRRNSRTKAIRIVTSGGQDHIKAYLIVCCRDYCARMARGSRSRFKNDTEREHIETARLLSRKFGETIILDLATCAIPDSVKAALKR